MKLVFGVLAVASVIMLFGMIDDGYAESYQEIDLGLILSTCDASPIEFTSKYIHLINHTGYSPKHDFNIHFSSVFYRNHTEHSETEGLRIVRGIHAEHDSNRIILSFGYSQPPYWDIGSYQNITKDTSNYDSPDGLCATPIYHEGEFYSETYTLKPIIWNLPDEPKIQKRKNISDEYIIDLIARTFNLDIPDEPKQKDPNERSKYQVCFDKKERFKTELSELQSRYNTLETEHTTLESRYQTLNTNHTEALFTIEKLTIELNEAKKKIEELES